MRKTLFVVLALLLTTQIYGRFRYSYPIYPILGYAGSTGFLYGAVAFLPKTENNNIYNFLFMGNALGQIDAQAQYIKEDIFPYTNLILHGQYKTFFVDYYTTNSPDSEQKIHNSLMVGDVELVKQLDHDLFVSVFAEYGDFKYGSVNSQAYLYMADDTKLLYGAKLGKDTRDNIDSTKRGYLIEASVFRTNYKDKTISSNDKMLVSNTLDAKHFYTFDAFDSLLTMANRFYVANNSIATERHLYQQAFDGDGGLRGFSEYRFRGDTSAMVQSELRAKIIKIANIVPISGVGFAEWGWVEDVQFGIREAFSYGGGLRVGLPPKYNTQLRFDLGVSEEGVGFYAVFGERF